MVCLPLTLLQLLDLVGSGAQQLVVLGHADARRVVHENVLGGAALLSRGFLLRCGCLGLVLFQLFPEKLDLLIELCLL